MVAPVFGNLVQLDIYKAYQTLTLCEGAGAARLGGQVIRTSEVALQTFSVYMHRVIQN